MYGIYKHSIYRYKSQALFRACFVPMFTLRSHKTYCGNWTTRLKATLANILHDTHNPFGVRLMVWLRVKIVNNSLSSLLVIITIRSLIMSNFYPLTWQTINSVEQNRPFKKSYYFLMISVPHQSSNASQIKDNNPTSDYLIKTHHPYIIIKTRQRAAATEDGTYVSVSLIKTLTSLPQNVILAFKKSSKFEKWFNCSNRNETTLLSGLKTVKPPSPKSPFQRWWCLRRCSSSALAVHKPVRKMGLTTDRRKFIVRQVGWCLFMARSEKDRGMWVGRQQKKRE